jgi:mono/diheme cytochrome c family protein
MTIAAVRRGVRMRSLMLLLIVSISGVAAFGQAGPGKENEIPLTYSFSGAEMYKTWCASCHGAEGKGDGPVAAALKKPPADLTQLAKKNGGKFPTEKVRNYIDGTKAMAAHGSRDMPVWGSFFRRLGEDNITYRVVTLATYVESLQVK